MSYLAVKYLHITFATLSGALFVLRGIWMMGDSAYLQRTWVRVAPHVIDTLLLTCALILVAWSGMYPGAQPWLSAKTLALLLYIVLGSFALKRGKTRTIRVTAFVAALAAFGYIVAVAITKRAAIFAF